MQTIRVTNDDLYRILAGREIGVEGNVKLRMYTADELLQESPNMTRAQAEDLTRTHDLYAMLEEVKEHNRRNRRDSSWLTDK